MKIVLFPERLPDEDTPIYELLKSLERDHPREAALFKSIKNKLENSTDMTKFDQLRKLGYIERLKDELWEFRIPPKKKGGVLRIYFCFSKIERQKIVLLDGELKKRKRANTTTAMKRLKAYREWEKTSR